MTERGKQRAVSALLNSRTFGDMYFPQVWVVGDSVYFTGAAAKRAEEFDGVKAEVMTINEAWQITHGKRLPADIISKVDVNIDQSGNLFNGNLYCQANYISKSIQDEIEKVEVIDNMENFADIERENIKKALIHTRWNKVRAAAIVGLSVYTLNKKIKEYNIKL